MRRISFLAALLIALVLPASAQQRKVLITTMPPAAVEELQQSVPELKLVAVPAAQAALEIADAEAYFGEPSPDLLAKAPKLRWVQLPSAGAERVLTPQMKAATNITLTNAKIIQGPQIADHAFALLLGLTRQLRKAIDEGAQENWDRGAFRLVELSGKTALIIGVGGIGTQIAQRAHGFGMNVIGVDPKDIPVSNLVPRTVHPDRLDDVLPLADVIFVSAPHTPKSENMLGPRQFSLMKKGAFFIAVSRGKLYDTPSLVQALDSQHLAGAGLDVTNPEPLPKGHPLWKFKNVLITPHIAGSSDVFRHRSVALLKENLRRFAHNEPLLNVVDKEAGY